MKTILKPDDLRLKPLARNAAVTDIPFAARKAERHHAGPSGYEPEDEGFFELSEKIQDKVEEPPRYVVYILNDDYTTFDFVVHVLVNIFRKSIEEAIRITNDVHHRGKGACGMYTKQIAETKVMLVEEASSNAGYPLRAVMEEA